MAGLAARHDAIKTNPVRDTARIKYGEKKSAVALDLDTGTVEIRGTVIRVKGQGLRIKPKPKSRAGYRKLLVPSGHWLATGTEVR